MVICLRDTTDVFSEYASDKALSLACFFFLVLLLFLESGPKSSLKLIDNLRSST